MGLSGVSLESLSRFLEEATRRYAALGAAAHGQGVEGYDEADNADALTCGVARAIMSSLAPELDGAWENAAQVFSSGDVVKGIVTGWNKGGLLVRWDELQGFVPASQLRDVSVFECDDEREGKLARWVGEELALKVIELDRSRNRLVFSERATVWGPKDGEHLLAEVVPGETRHGIVSNLCDFGAFVDLGGVDGLIHLSELSWRRINHPRELLAIGQPVDVYVISVDRENRRVALSLKRLRPNPWSIVDQRYQVGDTLDAVITNVVEFGAFAQIEEGLEGLIHISEMADIKIAHPSEVVSPGDPVRVRILRIDSASHRLGLSMRLTDHAREDGEETAWEGNANFLY